MYVCESYSHIIVVRLVYFLRHFSQGLCVGVSVAWWNQAQVVLVAKSSQRMAIQNIMQKAAINLQCRLYVNLMAALFHCIVILFKEIAHHFLFHHASGSEACYQMFTFVFNIFLFNENRCFFEVMVTNENKTETILGKWIRINYDWYHWRNYEIITSFDKTTRKSFFACENFTVWYMHHDFVSDFPGDFYVRGAFIITSIGNESFPSQFVHV